MNFKLSGNKMINGDIVSPEMPYAVFNDDLAPGEAQKIVSNLNHGSKMLNIYKRYYYSLHIENVVAMLKEMEAAYQAFDKEMFEIKRTKR